VRFLDQEYARIILFTILNLRIMCRCTHKLYINALRMFIEFVSAAVPFILSE